MLACGKPFLSIFFLLTLLGCQESFSGRKPPKAEQGILDLREWNFTKDGPLDLKGKFEFEPKQFVAADDFTPSLNPRFLDFPGPWNVKLSDGSEIEKKSFGSYRLKLLVDKGDDEFAMRFYHRRVPFRLYLNGKLIAQNGVVSDNKEIARSAIISKVIPIDVNQGENFLVLHVANFVFPKGGTRTAFRFGTYQSLINEREASLNARLFVFGGIFIMALYHFILFLLRRDEKSTVYCGIFCLSALAGALCEGNMYIAKMFPTMSWEAFFKFRWAGIIAFLFGMVNFFHSVFSDYVSKKVVKIVSYVSVPSLLFLFLADFRQYIQFFMFAFLPFLGCVILYIVFASVRSMKSYPKESLVITGGLVFWAATMINDVLNTNFVIQTAYIAVYGMFIFIFSLATLLSMRFSWAFRDLNTAQIEIRELNAGLENMVKQKTADIRSMMLHIRQGIFALAGKGAPVIQKDYSQHLEDILHTQDIAGATIEGLLLGDSTLNSDEKNIIEETIKFSMIGDELTYLLNEHNLPKELTYSNLSDQQKILEIDWGPIANSDDPEQVDKVLVCIRDVSEQRKLQDEAKAQQRELSIIDEILRLKPERFNDFIETSQGFIKQNRQLIEENKEYSKDVLKILFINMHTLKGNARTFHFQLMTGAVHEAEQAYSALQQEECEWDQTKLLADLDIVQESLEEYIRVNIEKLGRKQDSGDYKTVKTQLLKNMIDNLDKIDNPDESIKKIQYQLHRIYYHHIVDVFKEITSGVDALARDLKKEIPVVEIDSSDILLTNDALKIFNDVFVHILRNSMDHGIEDGVTRKKAGKKPSGKIAISFSKTDSQIVVDYRDDGKGLNLPLLKDKGIQTGYFNSDKKLDNTMIAELIFESGLSTADKVSEISGRGVGMDAVRNYLVTNGGGIHLDFTGPENENGFIPFSFRIVLPSSFSVTV